MPRDGDYDDPTDIAPDALDPDEPLDDAYFGAEAAPGPFGEHYPDRATTDTRSELPYTRSSVGSDFRELERRVFGSLSPAFPNIVRRKLPLESVWRWYRTLAMVGRSDVVDEFGQDPLFSARVEPMLRFLYRRYFRVRVEGGEHIPRHGAALLVANHAGALPFDSVMLPMAAAIDTPAARSVRPLVEDFVFHFPFVGPLLNRMGAVRADPENATRLLDDGQLVAVFPEGEKGLGKPFRERYQLQRFGRGGFVKLALATGAPIVPVAIVGSEETHPTLANLPRLARMLRVPYVPVTPTFPALGPLGLVPLPARWHIRFGAPLDVAAEHGADAARDRVLVGRLAETIRARIQEMVDDMVTRRKSWLTG